MRWLDGITDLIDVSLSELRARPTYPALLGAWPMSPHTSLCCTVPLATLSSPNLSPFLTVLSWSVFSVVFPC